MPAAIKGIEIGEEGAIGEFSFKIRLELGTSDTAALAGKVALEALDDASGIDAAATAGEMEVE